MLLYRICVECSAIEWKEGTYEDHNFVTVTTPATCQAGGYDTKTCQICGKVEICNEMPIAEHAFEATYTTDNSFHWLQCQNCEACKEKTEHTDNNAGVCAICNYPIGPTEGIIYDLSTDGTVYEVIGYEGTATQICIAEEYNGLPVKVIYKEAFKSNKTITSVIIPDSVTSIDYAAFYGCYKLTSVTIPNSVTSIGKYAFAYCDSLKSVTIPDSVTSIGDGAFYQCTSLTSVTIPDSVITSIGNNAFYGCNSALYTEYELGKYVGNETNPYAFLIAVTNKNMSTYVIHPDTKVIAYGVFEYCSRLTSITIPDGVRGISDFAFKSCSSLTSVTIPDSVTSIGGYAFDSCTSLTSVTIGDSVTSIDYSAFSNCTALTSVTFEGTLEQWNAIEKDSTWDLYTGSYTIYCSDGEISKDGTITYYTHTHEYTASVADPLATSIEVTYTCTCGDSYTETVIPTAFTVTADNRAMVGYTGEEGENLVIPAVFESEGVWYRVTKIDGSAFSHCSNLVRVTIPASVTSIGSCAFEYCSNLQSIVIPDGVTKILGNTFDSCTKLTQVVIPTSVTRISAGAFLSCTSLANVYYKGSAEQWSNITIGEDNSALTNATIHYNYVTE